MSLLIAPYNNAMRLGQGFNSYTQQICIDDAVVIDPGREENVVNNSGLTMKMLAEQTGTLSALERLPGLASSSTVEPSETARSQGTLGPAGSANPPAAQSSSSSLQIKAKDNTERATPAHKADSAASKPVDPKAKRSQEREKMLKDATSFGEAKSLDEIMETLTDLKQRVEEQTTSGIQDVRRKTAELPWTVKDAHGPGQVVTYTSKFVNKLSEITDEMSISGSLSIKYNAIGGSGSGSFFDAEKFYDSDLKYFVSVKVVNQTINYKDPLAFVPLRSVMKDQEKFNNTFGDSFISGFLEGGEFTALVLVNIHNKNKKRDITAQAKVALTAGPVEVSAQGNVKLAEENIKNNSETSVYVRWCGGGNIKPYDDEWTIDSVMAAAARFPALVGLFPQRTYAVLTKYETLRSYLALKPAKLTPLRYELAQMYTNILLDAYMEYKSLARRISSDIADVQAGLKEIQSYDMSTRLERSTALKNANLDFFPETLIGLDAARRAIRNQMNLIVREVDLLTEDPEVASDASHKQPFVGPASFSILLPEVNLLNSRKRSNVSPLDVKRINSVSDTKQAVVDDTDENSPPLFNPNTTALRLGADEQAKVAELDWQSEGIGALYQVSPPVGDQDSGFLFCTLDFAQSEESISEISAVMDSNGMLASLVFGFNNGLIFTYGKPVAQTDLDSAPECQKLSNIDPVGERIVSGVIQILDYTNESGEPKQRVVGLRLTISEERKLEALCTSASAGQWKLTPHLFGIPSSGLKLAGLWGRMQEDGSDAGVRRLGFIWGQVISTSSIAEGKTSKPEHITSLSRSVWPKMSEPLKVKFPSPLIGTPRMILGPHYLKSSDKQTMDRLHMKVEMSKLTAAGFDLSASTRIKEDSMFCNWMVLPEIKSTIINSGEVDVQDCQGKISVEVSINFPRPFQDKTVPDIQCWFTALSATPKGSNEAIHVKITVLPNEVTHLGAKVKIEALKDTRLQDVRIGWIAHSKPPESNSDFVSGNVLINDIEKSGKRELKLSAPLTDKPISQFVGINELHAETKSPISFAATILPETSKDTVCLNASSLGSSDVHVLGLTWIVSM
ncbi:hypothetical protein A4X09_0g4946 [Tilletia walkeri]|uniref:H-type lectin domain-containing protein n=1 Tax=Tilletia walkeri TaxID=117179 RepID=A0A8X7N693_9BASI|nr:hypothetical protein A4X09_0g4946 [Tilletia walkeri]